MDKKEKTDLRILRTRRLIVLAFNELIEEKGFDPITVQDIAVRAMINRSTFYAHFTDKYDLFGFIIRGSFLDYLNTQLTSSPEWTMENIRLLTTAVFEFMGNLNTSCQKHQPDHCRPIIEAQVQTQLYEYLLDRLRQTELPSHTAQPESVASMISWVLFGAGLQWNKENSVLEKDVVINDVMQLIGTTIQTSTPEQAPA